MTHRLALFMLLIAGCSTRTIPADASVDGGPAIDAGPTDAGPTCAADERVCGTTCCTDGDLCGTNVRCCAAEDLCGSTCCGAGEVCEGAVCRLDCGAQARCTDASGAATCCGASEVCASNQCFRPDTPCDDFFECPDGQYCERTLGRCLPQPGGEPCVVRPTGGDVVPTLLWHWDGTGAAVPESRHVMMAPMVANLTDDNGDTRIDENDVPDVVFNTFCGPEGMCGTYQINGILRAVDGRDGSSLFDVTDPSMRVIGGAQIAIANIDDDPMVEIVTCGSDADLIGALIAFEHDGTFKWRTTDPRVSCTQAAPSIADLDADGDVEVFVRYTVVNGADGSVAWHNDCAPTWREWEHNPCDYTTAADLDADGRLEVIGGNVAFRADGSVYYDRRADFRDGYPAIGDLDLDDVPEVIVVHSSFYPNAYQGDHFLRALRSNGTDFWGPIDINQGLAPAEHVTTGDVGGGGPPTIASFDDDPAPEIGVAGAYGYAVFEPNGTLRWSSVTDDRTSRKTGSSVFDFDGDGVAEVVYNDHYWLRVYDGRNGDVRFCMCNTSATLWEYPVIVDVDNDGHAEIVVASNTADPSIARCETTPGLGQCELDRIAAGEVEGTNGVRVFASPTRDWVATRRIWNQHSYHVTNVSESGQVPTVERANWTVGSLNNFRQNVQPGAANVPDLAARDLAVDLSGCPSRMTLHFVVVNEGWAAAPAGVPVTIYVEEGGTFARLGTVMTTRMLLPGEGETLSMPYNLGARDPNEEVRMRVVINDGTDAPLETLLECRAENNTAEVGASCSFLI